MGFIEGIFSTIGDLTWGWALVPFLVVLGLIFTVMSGFAQFRFFGRMWGVLKEGRRSDGGISSRQALLVSIGGRVGGGNVAGVAVAIVTGGPGAVFWMWAIALVGMATSIIECSLAQLYKRTEANGEFRGGPARYIVDGLGERFRWLAILYAICLIAAFALGFAAFQGNTVAGAAQDSIGIGRIWTALFLAAITSLVIIGGIRRIAQVADVIIPIMALAYILIALIVIVINIADVPGVIWLIVSNAFGLQEVAGGGMGAALSAGLRRGLFSNEAGLGSVPNVAATAHVSHPVSQGITQSLSVFIDTMIICTCTAFVILLGGVYAPGTEMDGVVLTQQSVVDHLGAWGQYFLTFALLFFAFSSIIYNYYLGETAVVFMTANKMAIQVLRVAVVGIVFIGALAPGATAVFFFSDPMMGLLALVNLVALAMLFPIAMRLIDDYRRQLHDGIDEPQFDSGRFSDLSLDRQSWPSGAPRRSQ